MSFLSVSFALQPSSSPVPASSPLPTSLPFPLVFLNILSLLRSFLLFLCFFFPVPFPLDLFFSNFFFFEGGGTNGLHGSTYSILHSSRCSAVISYGLWINSVGQDAIA